MATQQTIDSLRSDLALLGQDHILALPNASNLIRELSVVPYPGGCVQYLQNAQKLLAQAASGVSPLDDVVSLERPDRVFNVPVLFSSTAAPTTLQRTAFVLVAGGLGERLGFSGIKLALPMHTLEPNDDWTYIRHYCMWLMESAGPQVPFVIMTSSDTHTRTVALLEKHNYFGLRNVTLLQQETVPALSDSSAKIAVKVDPSTGEGKILRKPPGHGDVHYVLHSSGIVSQWQAQGNVDHIVFFQDTHGEALCATIPLTLDILRREHLWMTFTCVPRVPGEAVGALTSLTFKNGERKTVNVEYNILDAVLRATTSGGDAAESDSSPFSKFPGAINCLALDFAMYSSVLGRTQGSVPDIVAPKYADASRTTFKSPTRLERLMQDYAILLQQPSVIGGKNPNVVQMERDDLPLADRQRRLELSERAQDGPVDTAALSQRIAGVVYNRAVYDPPKNTLVDGIAKFKQGLPADTAATGEEGILRVFRMELHAAGVLGFDAAGSHLSPSGAVVSEPDIMIADALPLRLFPAVVWDPTFATDAMSLSKRFPRPHDVRIGAKSVLILRGDVTVETMALGDAAVKIVACPGASVRVASLSYPPPHSVPVAMGVRACTPKEAECEITAMRGFVYTGSENMLLLEAKTPGAYIVEGNELRMVETPTERSHRSSAL